MESDFIKKRKLNPSPLTQIDHDTGLVYLPGKDPKTGRTFDPQPLIGPTTGRAYEKLKQAEKAKREWNKTMVEQLAKVWKCTQCGKIWRCRFLPNGFPAPGQLTVRPTAVYAETPTQPEALSRQTPPVEAKYPAGLDLMRLRCGDAKCDGPVIEVRPLVGMQFSGPGSPKA